MIGRFCRVSACADPTWKSSAVLVFPVSLLALADPLDGREQAGLAPLEELGILNGHDGKMMLCGRRGKFLPVGLIKEAFELGHHG
jgi:hypothetical protein